MLLALDRCKCLYFQLCACLKTVRATVNYSVLLHCRTQSMAVSGHNYFPIRRSSCRAPEWQSVNPVALQPLLLLSVDSFYLHYHHRHVVDLDSKRLHYLLATVHAKNKLKYKLLIMCIRKAKLFACVRSAQN